MTETVDQDPGREPLEAGIRYARGGALDKALEALEAACARATSPALRAEALRHLADAHRTRCEFELAVDIARRSQSEAELADAPDLIAEALNAEAAVHQTRGDHDAARVLYQRMLEITSNERVHGIARQNLGVLAASAGDFDTASREFEASLDAFRRSGYQRGEAIARINIARAEFDAGDVAGASRSFEEAIAAVRRIDDMELLATAMLNQAEILTAQGELGIAVERASAALGHFLAIENAWRQVECLRLLGDIHQRRKDPEVARRCFRQAHDLAQRIGAGVEAAQLEARLNALAD
ncbi:MAG: tetratricopeptide repeat protein [Longimicrobiales bacterium]